MPGSQKGKILGSEVFGGKGSWPKHTGGKRMKEVGENILTLDFERITIHLSQWFGGGLYKASRDFLYVWMKEKKTILRIEGKCLDRG